MKVHIWHTADTQILDASIVVTAAIDKPLMLGRKLFASLFYSSNVKELSTGEQSN